MIRLCVLSVSLLFLQGCSFLVEIALFNNSDERIEICNLNMQERLCQQIDAQTMSKVVLMGDKPSEQHRFSIESKGRIGIYEFVFDEPYPTHASDVYCEGLIQKQCDIPLQFEVSGELYWAGKKARLPVDKLPPQPKGFPISPST
ncbi:hypothetical protein ACFSJ3_10830 [Corallincola platygyrae]|uniref:Lipoprotein n=1 Tax=Corallincola platygyrae TaxID=1193278 RepID=A0ABW4XLN3_9GAMM